MWGTARFLSTRRRKKIARDRELNLRPWRSYTASPYRLGHSVPLKSAITDRNTLSSTYTHSCTVPCTLSVWPCPSGRPLGADDTRSGTSCCRTRTPAWTAKCPADSNWRTWRNVASGSDPVDSICLPGRPLHRKNLCRIKPIDRNT